MPYYSIQDRETVERVAEVLRRQFLKPASVRDLAKMVAMEPFGLRVIFHQLEGDSIQARVRRLRMEHARRLMVDDGFSVNQAARAVGYHEAGSFERAYVKTFGKGPSEQRDASLGTGADRGDG